MQNETAHPGDRAQGMQTTVTNTNTANFNGQTSFQNPPRGVTSTNSPTGPSNNRYSQPPNKGPGRKTSKHNLNNTQPSTSAMFTQPSSYPQSRNLGTGQPKMFCTTCGEYNHWRKDCPYDCHCDNCDSDSHANHMCRAPPKPSPTPSPQPLICIYCGSSDHRSMECSNHPRDNREEGHAPSPAPNWYNQKTTEICFGFWKIHKSPMVSQEIMTNLGPLVKIPKNLKQVGNIINSNNVPHKANKIIIAFLTGITGTMKQLRQTRFNEKQNQLYSPYHFAPSPALSAGSDMLSRSIMQLAETQSHSLEIFAAQQKSQIDVYQELTRSNKEKEHDALFTSIPVFDGDRTQCEQWLDDMDQATRISGHDLRTELIKKSTGVVRNVIMMAHPETSDDDLINMLHEDFSDAPTMNEAWEELLHMHQKPEEQMHVYVYRYRSHAPEVIGYKGS